ncbi:MAG: BrnA antitoxin family protein [Thermomicrobia bacterium]|nr:BrnA antitoxin family protein [Thermomicrobia bacterium]
MNRPSETDGEHIDALTDDLIDTSDIAPLDDTFFARARFRRPGKQESVTVHVGPDVLAWFHAQGEQWESRMRAALRIYVDAHQE